MAVKCINTVPAPCLVIFTTTCHMVLLQGNTTNIDTIFIVQKRIIRAIYKLGDREFLRDVFKRIGILTVASHPLYHDIDIINLP